MNIATAMTLFLALLFLHLAVLELRGGIGALFLVTLSFLLGLVMKRVTDRRQAALAAAAEEQEEGEPEDLRLREAEGLAPLRQELARRGFEPLHAALLPEIGRYAEIFSRGDTCAEVVVDEEDLLPHISLRTFFRGGFAVTTDLAPVRRDAPPQARDGEFHWMPGEPLESGLAFHDARVAALAAAGREPERRDRPDYAAERARTLGDGKRGAV